MLLNPAGLPEPPAGMVNRLKQIDPHFSLLFGFKSKCWNITYDWPDSDPRRALVRQGAVAPERAFDIFCQLPPDCSADEAFGYLVRTLKRAGGKGDTQRLLDRVAEYNKKREQEILQPHRDLAEELIETNAGTLFRDFGKTVGRTKAPRGRKNTDEKRRRDYLHDLGHAVEPTTFSKVVKK